VCLDKEGGKGLCEVHDRATMSGTMVALVESRTIGIMISLFDVSSNVANIESIGEDVQVTQFPIWDRSQAVNIISILQ
jgi:hypothetical protein